jgi:hypothetical protein
MEQYRRNWMEDTDRMCSDSSPKMILKYQLNGKRSSGRPLISACITLGRVVVAAVILSVNLLKP